ncbi:MAG: alpha/beta hydrolase [Ruminococcus sp.]|nr:alpha/beta hydrolase [Ruminococcus sp.]
MKLCILFPGIGYHCDKPLLYYTARAARAKGYEVIPLRFTDFPQGAKGNAEKMRAAADHAFAQAAQQLADVDFTKYDRVVFAGKSIGTAACLAYREQHSVSADCVLFTPLEMTFEHPAQGCIAFHGTADPWADTGRITSLCEENAVPLNLFEGANHSLETGDVTADISALARVMERVGEWL